MNLQFTKLRLKRTSNLPTRLGFFASDGFVLRIACIVVLPAKGGRFKEFNRGDEPAIVDLLDYDGLRQ